MVLYAVTILVSAFLLFQVQPVIAKIILPWFGGSSAVWTTCLLFFQVVLLLGYLYAHAVTRYLRPRVQMLVHGGLLLVSVAALPIYPNVAWKPSGAEEPTWAILRLLAITVGLPYFLLSTTAPLLQAWYARRFKGAVPYRLYALSNAGSMAALLSYPLLFEPTLTAHLQSWTWSAAYGVFVVLCGLTAYRGPGAGEQGSGESAPLPPVPTKRGAKKTPAKVEAGPGIRLYLLWLALPACASVLLLAITSHLSQNVAAIPFLWVLPLSLYLLSFVLCFEGSGWYRPMVWLPLLMVALAAMAYAHNQATLPIKLLVPLFAAGLFVCCMVMHGELARLKPDPKYLTHFYLTIAAGGTAGGLLVGLVAPNLFSALYELHIGLAACALLALIAARDYFPGLLSSSKLLLGACAAALGTYLIYDMRGDLLRSIARAVITSQEGSAARMIATHWSEPADFLNDFLFVCLLLGAAALVAALHFGKLRGRAVACSAEFVLLVLAGYLTFHARKLTGDYRLSVRNFYGTLRTSDSGPPTPDATRKLTHGSINHGEQFLHPARRVLPTTYYGTNSGIGIAIREKQKTGPIRVGVVGLGTGTIAAYGRPGDYYRFYELNPLVLQLAQSEFTFLGDSKASVEVAMGDARLSLEREADENYDVLAVDAFSSDAIPVHLLTREAMAVYFRHLKRDGILAVHVSNRFLDIQPVLAGQAAATGSVARTVVNAADKSQEVYSATWVLMTSTAAGFDQAEIDSSVPVESGRAGRLWTDDYSNLFQILK